MKIEWSEKLSVGYSVIDNQHKELIDRVNMLLDAMLEGKGRSKLGEVVVFITEYVVTHFATEEELMKKFNYPGYDSHKKEHEDLVSDFMQRKTVLETASPSSSDVIKTYNWLAEWVSGHIIKTDTKLGAFLDRK